MSDENQIKKEAVVEVIQDVKSENYKAAADSSLNSVTNFFEELFNKKLPKMPKGFLDFMVQNMPIFNIIGMVWKGFLILTGALTFLASFALIFFSPTSLTIISVLSALIGVVGSSIAFYFAIKAHSGLEPKKTVGWNNLYHGWIVAIIFGILTTATSFGNALNFSNDYGAVAGAASSVILPVVISSIVASILFSLALDALILYVLFQIRNRYNNK